MMKQLVVVLSISLGMCIQESPAQKKEFTEVIKKELTLSNPEKETFVIRNINGSIDVKAYDGDVILLEIERRISAKNSEKLELGKEEVKLETRSKDNKLIVFVDLPCVSWGEDEGFKYRACHCEKEPGYDFELDFKIKVPLKTNLELTTVNDGEVMVANTRGNAIKVGNINGGIDLSNITGRTEINCINGDVQISYADNPIEDSTYYSLNGDINISYQTALSANISFKSMNGEMFTDFDINKQFMKTNTSPGRGGKPKYKYESKPVVQIGNGSVDFDFETLNGNVYIKKI